MTVNVQALKELLIRAALVGASAAIAFLATHFTGVADPATTTVVVTGLGITLNGVHAVQQKTGDVPPTA